VFVAILRAWRVVLTIKQNNSWRLDASRLLLARRNIGEIATICNKGLLQVINKRRVVRFAAIVCLFMLTRAPAAGFAIKSFSSSRADRSLILTGVLNNLRSS